MVLQAVIGLTLNTLHSGYPSCDVFGVVFDQDWRFQFRDHYGS